MYSTYSVKIDEHVGVWKGHDSDLKVSIRDDNTSSNKLTALSKIEGHDNNVNKKIICSWVNIWVDNVGIV